MNYHGALINGSWTSGEGLATISVENPATGDTCGEISACGEAQATLALEAAKAAVPGWASASIDERAVKITAFRDALVAKKAEIVAALVAETGKVTGNAEYDFDMLVNCLPYHIENVRRAYTSVIPSPDNTTFSYTRHSPVGVVVCVLTWNFPLLNLGYKLGPILASGCTCVIKPSELTPLATSMALSCLSEAGFPAGVVNVVNGTGVDLVEPLCASRIPRLLTCIGSTVMGRRMIGYGSTSIKRFSLELGGDAPVLVFPDCDLDAAVADIVGLKFGNAGQICVSPNRVMVHADIYDSFLEKAAALAAKYDYGSGDDHAPKGEVLQPLCSSAALGRMLDLVADAIAKGARIVSGGKRVERAGHFLEPTIIADVADAMSCQSSEIFGPIMAVRAFANEDEAFKIANSTELGLSGYVYTASLETAMRAESELECGNVLIGPGAGVVHYSIELPHGGVKQSGYGKDISHLSLADYFDTKRVTIKRKRN